MKIKRQRGFTLLEVLLAVAIFAMAGGALIKAASEHINSVTMLKNITYATWVANNQLTEALIQNKDRWPPRNNLTGESEMAGTQFFWRQNVLKTQDSELNQVTVSVFVDAQRESQITSVSTFLARESE